MMHKEEEVSINRNDIFNYVVGKSSFDPIEHCIDPTQYEVQEEFIYDHDQKKLIRQNEDFIYFNKELGKLRNLVQDKQTRHKIGRAEIIKICKELEEIAPTTVKLPVPDQSSFFDLPPGTEDLSQSFKDRFGLPSPQWWKNRKDRGGDMKK